MLLLPGEAGTSKHKSLAVIGVGNVGSRVANKANALGMRTYLCDPPLRDSTGDTRYQSLDEVIGADILSFHVPLCSVEPLSDLAHARSKTSGSIVAGTIPYQLLARGPFSTPGN